VDKAKAEVERAEAKLKLALSKASRAKELNQRGEGPGGLAEETAQECQIARADLQIARANRESAQLGLAWTRIAAPIGGHIAPTSFDVGSLVKAEKSTLTTIACLDPLYVSIELDELTWFALRKRVQRGEFQDSEIPVEVSVPQVGVPWRKGTLEFMEDAAFNMGRTTVQVRVPNGDGTLVPGLWVSVRYALSKPHSALMVPEKSFAVDGQQSVWVIGDGNIPERRAVEATRRPDSDFRAVTRGLKPDEWIIRDAELYSRVARGLPIEPKRVP
jgi:RND family efflux transporter MFP subunit